MGFKRKMEIGVLYLHHAHTKSNGGVGVCEITHTLIIFNFLNNKLILYLPYLI